MKGKLGGVDISHTPFLESPPPPPFLSSLTWKDETNEGPGNSFQEALGRIKLGHQDVKGKIKGTKRKLL